MRRIIKPSKQTVELILSDDAYLCYQYVNWWLYQKGSDEIIWSLEDNSDLYKFCSDNKAKIIEDLAAMVGAVKVEDRYGWLLK